MKIVHISDTHGAKYHTKLEIPECDVLIHSGDIGGRTSLMELNEFLVWFEAQPARKKIFIGGNHDLVLDRKWVDSRPDTLSRMLALQQHTDGQDLIKKYDVVYLKDKDYVFEGVKFWGSPMSPSFHRQHWAFNADRGQEISKYWSKIPSDVNVLITHTPSHGFLDTVPEEYLQSGETDIHRGCEDLIGVVRKRLLNLKLHCYGHIHDNVGCILESVSKTRRVMFSNGAVLTNDYTQLVTKPLIISI